MLLGLAGFVFRRKICAENSRRSSLSGQTALPVPAGHDLYRARETLPTAGRFDRRLRQAPLHFPEIWHIRRDPLAHRPAFLDVFL